jgi:endonuclease-3 related protein
MTPQDSPFLDVYERLIQAFGPQDWWPAESPFEVVVGAILTQNTSWTNVEKAIENLKREPFSAEDLFGLEDEEMAGRIKSAGYFNVKTQRLKAFLGYFLERYDGSLEAMKRVPLDLLRSELLTVNGIGQETADCILLYALERPSFVIDAYTRRIFGRLALLDAKASYEHLQGTISDALPEDVALYNEYHALIVVLGKDICRPKPRCGSCPLASMCPYSRVEMM